MQYSVALRNARLSSDETTIGTSPVLKVFGGAAMPVNCAAADAGATLATCSLPSDWQGAPSNGSADKAGTWEDLSADASGKARYFRMYDSTATTCHMQGLVSMAWTASTAYALDDHVNNGGNVYVCTTAGTSAGSGGPTGTGSGITDGTAVWSYVGTVDMTVNNINFAAGQAFTVVTFTRTTAGA